jgi:hypothetical protein
MASTNGQQLLANNGYSKAPGYSFKSSDSTGLYYDDNPLKPTLGLSVQEKELVEISPSDMVVSVPLSAPVLETTYLHVNSTDHVKQGTAFNESVVCNAVCGTITLWKALPANGCSKFSVFNKYLGPDTLVLVTAIGMTTDHPDYYPVSVSVANQRDKIIDIIVRNGSPNVPTDDIPSVRFLLVNPKAV